MKISIDKIVGEKIEIIDYLSNDIFIFKFKNLKQNILEDRWSAYQKSMNHHFDHFKKGLESEMLYKGYDSIGTRDELMKINLRHVFESEFYITNGQKIISVFKNDDTYSLGIHDFLFYRGYFPPNDSFRRFSLISFKFKSCKITEQIEALATGVLSSIQIRKIPVEDEFIEIKFAFNKYFLEYKKESYIIDESHPNKTRDVQFEKLLIENKLEKVKCCINCNNFKSITDGHLVNGKVNGNCDIIKRKLPDLEHPVTYMWHWCQNFEK